MDVKKGYESLVFTDKGIKSIDEKFLAYCAFYEKLGWIYLTK